MYDSQEFDRRQTYLESPFTKVRIGGQRLLLTLDSQLRSARMLQQTLLAIHARPLSLERAPCGRVGLG